jgi:hypothetical protein
MKSFAIRSVEKQVLHDVQDDKIYDKNFRGTTLASFAGSARRPVLKGICLQFAFKVHQLVLHPLLGVGDAAVIDEGPNLFQEEVNQQTRRQRIERFGQILLSVGLQGGDRLLAVLG